jgi:hypothetical protein
MADNQLAQAYSILGQATTSEYKRRRKEEDEYRKKARRDQLLGYVAAPLLKGAGEMLVGGIENLIIGKEEQKYDDFFSSEQIRAEKRKQQSGYNIAQKMITENEQALLDPEGEESYYANQRYQRLLENFNQTYDEKEYDEGAEILLREESKKWAAQNIGRIKSQVEKAYQVQSPEEYTKVFKAIKPRTPSQIVADKISGFFTGKDKRAMREEKVNTLIKNNRMSRESFLEARQSLGYEAPVAEMTEVASRLDDLKYNKEDWIVVDTKTVYKSLPVAGKTFTVSYKEEKRRHPEKNKTETVLVPSDARSREFLEQGKLGQVQESVTTTNALGQQVTTLITKSYTTGGVEIVNTTESKTELDPSLAAEKMTDGQRKVVLGSFNNVLRSMPSKNGKPIEVGIYLESDIEGMEATLAPRIFGLSRQLATQNLINMDPSQSYELASAMLLRSIDSEIEDPGFMRSFKVNPLKNNGLGLAKENPSLHILDAFYSLENSGVSNIGITKPEEQLLLQGVENSKGETVDGTGVYDAFLKLDRRSREVMLNNLPPQLRDQLSIKHNATFYKLFEATHIELTKKGL